jgi:SAM-dependent methyltransferase
MDNLFEIKDGEIDVNEIMKKIKENIAVRKSHGAYTEEDMRLIDSSHVSSATDPDQLNVDCSYICDNWNIENNSYAISSHRTLVGPIFVKSRQVVNNEVRRYVDPIILKQNQYNLHLSRYLNSVDDRINSSYSELDHKISSYQIEMNAKIEKMVNEKVNNVLSQLNAEIDNRSWLLGSLSKRLGSADPLIEAENAGMSGTVPIDYILFENRFRGSPQDIKERQSKFIKSFEGCNNILDIGCGRGEFLDLCKERNIKAAGIDTDQDMVNSCVARGLDVKKIDALSYLKSVEDDSIDGIFMDQVVEHLEPSYLVKLLEVCYKKMGKEGCIVIETVNPLCFIAFANFYIDPTHQKPVHPETLKFLIEYARFRDPQFVFSSPLSDDSRLKKINIETDFNEREKNIASLYNNNVEKLNDLLYGCQDYAIISRK